MELKLTHQSTEPNEEMNSISNGVRSVPDVKKETHISMNSESSNSFVRGNKQTVVNISNYVKFEDAIKTDKVSEAILEEMIDFISRTETRVQNEKEILQILAPHLKKLDSKLNIIPFGSSMYGFGGSKTNFNILVKSGKH